MLKDLIKLANNLDQLGLTVEADRLDRIAFAGIKKSMASSEKKEINQDHRGVTLQDETYYYFVKPDGKSVVYRKKDSNENDPPRKFDISFKKWNEAADNINALPLPAKETYNQSVEQQAEGG